MSGISTQHGFTQRLLRHGALALFALACSAVPATPRVELSASAAIGATATEPTLINEAPPARACVASASEVCFNAEDDNCNGLFDEGCGIRSGLVQFLAAWSQPELDIDLDVFDPLGDVAEVGTVTRAGLTKERDCPGVDQVCGARPFENVVLEAPHEMVRGRYRVRLRWVNHDAMTHNTTPDAARLHSENFAVNLGARLGPSSAARRIWLTWEQPEAQLWFEL